MEVPVFIINGFLESGKTSLILDTLKDPEFTGGEKVLLIACEEGEVEYDEHKLQQQNVQLVVVDEESSITNEFLELMEEKYHPKRVILEWNGMWDFEEFLEVEMPINWVLAQILTTIDATTFTNYVANFKAILASQFRYADTIIVNRCTANTDMIGIRRTIKPINRKASIGYEGMDGQPMNAGKEELPFDINAPVIELADEDYGLWYMDILDHPEAYNKKTVKFRAMVYKADKLPNACIVPGRFAMTCCADDITFVGFLCHVKDTHPLDFYSLKSRMWIHITANINVEYYKEYGGNGPVLYATAIEPANEPEEKLVYFN